MPGPMKRTRSTNPNDENDPSPPTASTTTPTRRRTTTTSSQPPADQPPPTTPHASTPTRPILTRSSTTLGTSLNSPLTRSNSMFAPSTRRSNAMASSSSSWNLSLPGPSAPPSRGPVGTLARTQSTPSIASPESIKNVAVAGGGSGGRGKGDDEPDFNGHNLRKHGKGKENIPPKKDEPIEDDGASSRKRMRVGRRSSAASSRARSGSVSSMRSESISGRMPSLAPSSSSSFSVRGSRFPSPSPSLSSVTTPSLSSFASADPLDLIGRDMDMDVDKTPTKPKTRAAARRTTTAPALPTPPSSSPILPADEDLDVTTERISLVRMQSDATTSSTPEDDLDDTDVEDEGETVTKKPLDPYKRLKSHLRLSTAANQTIIGREDEQTAIRSYLASVDAIDVGMYVSGPPGTGKTATVTAIGREKLLHGWQTIEMGCMGMKIPDVWRRLGEQLSCGKAEADVQLAIASSKRNILLILDEIDSFLPPPPTAATPQVSHLLSKLFSLPFAAGGRVKVIAISNTLDLTLRARLVLPESHEPVVLPFKAYVGADMINIVASRLVAAGPVDDNMGVKVNPKAVELLTKKVEAQNGDLRMCLGVLSGAVSLAETEWRKKVTDGVPIPLIKISLAHTIRAFNSHTQQLKAAAGSGAGGSSSVTGKKIRSVPLHGKMVLLAMLVFVSRVRAGEPGCPAVSSAGPSPPATPTKSGEALTTANLYATYAHILSHQTSPFPASPESDYRDLLSNLEVLGLVSLSLASVSMSRAGSGTSTRKSAQTGQRIELCVRAEEIKEGLGLAVPANQTRGSADEEVAKIWEREEGRLRKLKDKTMKASLERMEALGEI